MLAPALPQMLSYTTYHRGQCDVLMSRISGQAFRHMYYTCSVCIGTRNLGHDPRASRTLTGTHRLKCNNANHQPQCSRILAYRFQGNKHRGSQYTRPDHFVYQLTGAGIFEKLI